MSKLEDERAGHFSVGGWNALTGSKNDNQDSAVVNCNINQSKVMLLGVFDGHGPMGHVASGYAASRVQDSFPAADIENAKTDKSVAGLLAGVITGIQADFKAQDNFDAKHCGCTATVAIVSDNRAHVAYVGDSMALLVRKGHGGSLGTSSPRQGAEA